jgi:hypothetical protein
LLKNVTNREWHKQKYYFPPNLKRSDLKMVSVMQKVVGLFLTVVLAAALIPSALTTFNAANTSGWSAEQIALWGVIGVIIIVAVIMLLIPSD